MGALLHYLHHRQLSFDEKDESYPGVIARDSGGFHLRTQLNDALIESYRAGKRTFDNLLEGDRRLPERGCKGDSSTPTIVSGKRVGCLEEGS